MAKRWWGCAATACCLWLVSGCFDSDGDGEAHGVPTQATPVTPAAPTPPPADGPSGWWPAVTGCQLLGAAEVAAALGAPRITTNERDNGRSCLFYEPDGTHVLTLRISDLPRQLLGGPEQVTSLTASPSERTERIPDLADAAVFYSDPQLGNGVAFARARGDRVMSVNITAAGPRAQSTRDVLVPLGRRADEALP